MERPRVSNIVAVLLALWVGATCAGACTYVAAPVAPKASMSCVVLTRAPMSDSLVVGVYDPPCGETADSVFYWRVLLPPRCGLIGMFDASGGQAQLRTVCPPANPGVRLSLSPGGPR